MAINFPVSLDSFTNPQSTDTLDSPSHSGQHADVNDAVEALQAKVGVDSSSVTTSLDYKIAQIETNGVTLAGSQTLTNKTINGAIVNGLEENWYVASLGATGTINFDVLTSSSWFYNSNATADWTLNIRGDASTTLNSLLDVGDSITVSFAALQGNTPYILTSIQIDGTTLTPIWQGPAAPTSGNANSVDVYLLTILKRTSNPIYTIFASQTQFK